MSKAMATHWAGAPGAWAAPCASPGLGGGLGGLAGGAGWQAAAKKKSGWAAPAKKKNVFFCGGGPQKNTFFFCWARRLSLGSPGASPEADPRRVWGGFGARPRGSPPAALGFHKCFLLRHLGELKNLICFVLSGCCLGARGGLKKHVFAGCCCQDVLGGPKPPTFTSECCLGALGGGLKHRCLMRKLCLLRRLWGTPKPRVFTNCCCLGAPVGLKTPCALWLAQPRRKKPCFVHKFMLPRRCGGLE